MPLLSRHTDKAAQEPAKETWSPEEKQAGRAILIVSVLLLIGAAAFRYYNATPNVIIPPPAPLPNPNAFDFYREAEIMTPNLTSLIFSSDPPYYYFRPSFPGNTKNRLSEASKHHQAIMQTAQANAPALRVLRRGFAFPCRVPPQRAPDTRLSFREIAKLRDMACLFDIEARVLAARGDWNDAMQCRLDGIRYGSDLMRGATVDMSLFPIKCEGTARRDADKIIPHLSASQARIAAKRLATLYQNRVTLPQVLQEEKWLGLNMLKTAFVNPRWRKVLARRTGLTSSDDLTNPYQIYTRAELSTLRADTLLNNYTTRMDIAIAHAKLPYSAPRRKMPQNLRFYDLGSEWRFTSRKFAFAANDARNAFLLTALALRAFEAEKGRLPQSLKELVPSYLSQVPADPFGKGESLRYLRKSNRKYTLHSIGPDGKDDGGKLPSRPGRPPEKHIRKYLWRTDDGDMVFGIHN